MAGGTGSRLFPVTKVVSKQLLPIFDKPMIYYPLSVLMLAKIREVLIISTTNDLPLFKRLLGDGSDYGMKLSYKAQNSPNGIAEAFIIGKDFIGDDNVALLLGDNIFYGQFFSDMLTRASSKVSGATIFGYKVKDPERFCVVEFDEKQKVISLEEKPSNPKTNFAVIGLYFYDNRVVEFAEKISPSERGELEITCINKKYQECDELNLELLGRGFTWIDTGTFESLLEATQFVKTIETNQGYKIACLEEIAFRNKWINKEKLLYSAGKLENSIYKNYLVEIANEIFEENSIL